MQLIEVDFPDFSARAHYKGQAQGIPVAVIQRSPRLAAVPADVDDHGQALYYSLDCDLQMSAVDWMKARGKPVQFVRVGADGDVRARAAIARQHNAILSFSEGDPEQIGIATGGRFHYRMKGDEDAIRLAASGLLGKSI